MKICHDAKVVLWLLKEMTSMSLDFMKIPQTAEEVADQLMDIFYMFSAPFILQSDNGREFVNKILQNLADMCPGMKLVHGKLRHSQSQGSVERSNEPTCWLLGCPTTTRKPCLKDCGVSKARNGQPCIQALRQALMRLSLEGAEDRTWGFSAH
jgi:hypothetical protein